ncbi:hypothetical protein [Streptococcus suis]|uniref:hypothetical protein n=1 Tax=Streptococcus suis TaxID=1307 RepID=UPI000AF8E1E3
MKPFETAQLLKLPLEFKPKNECFETIRNSTALKRRYGASQERSGFETIRNSTALKRPPKSNVIEDCFETIRNSTASKTQVLSDFLDREF